MNPLPCPVCGKPLMKIRSCFKQSYVWSKQDHSYVQEGHDYTAFHCANCGEEIGGGYFEQIDDRRWGVIPETDGE